MNELTTVSGLSNYNFDLPPDRLEVRTSMPLRLAGDLTPSVTVASIGFSSMVLNLLSD